MEIKEMSVEELLERRTAIAAEIDEPEADLDALENEVRSINEELDSRKNAEAQRVEIRKAVASGEGTVVKTIEKEEKKMFSIDSVEYRNAWLKNLQGKELTVEERDGFTQTGDTATHAIPTIISDRFFEKMVKLAPMLSRITLLRVAGNVQFVAEGTRNTVSAHTENASISVSGDTTIAVSLGAVEFYKVLAVSESAKLMSIDAFEDWLIEMLAGDIARAIDNYIVNGAGKGFASTAVTYTTDTNQILNTEGATYDNIVDLIGLLPAAYDAEAEFVMNKKTLYGGVAKIKDSSGDPIFVTDPQTGLGRIMGYPVVTDDYVSTANGAIYLGKWSDVVGNLSQDINVITYPDYDHASVKYRGGAFFDCKPAKTDAFVRFVTTA